MSTTSEAAIDKVVVITGASGGIGAELAKQLGARGAKVVLAARRKPELDTVAKAIGGGALAVVTDVTKRADVERLAEAAIERFGRSTCGSTTPVVASRARWPNSSTTTSTRCGATT